MDSVSPTVTLALAAIAGYLLGSVPWGLVLTRLAGLGDIREIGSGNIGATNVLRTGNKFLALLTLILDVSKGGAAAWAAMELAPQTIAIEAGLIAGFTAVLGHNFPVWLGFKGGKGVATTLGVLLVAAFPVGALTCATWLLVAGTLRYSSLAAMAALGAAPVYAWWLLDERYAVMAGGLAILSIIRHRANVRRLLAGEEPKIGKGGAGETSKIDAHTP